MRAAWVIRGIGLLAVMVGVGAYGLFGRVSTVSCERTGSDGGVCRLDQSGLFGVTARTVPIADIRDAVVESSRDRRGSESFRWALVTDTGRVPVTDYYSGSAEGKRAPADRFRRYLADPAAPTFDETQDDRFFAAVFGLMFASAGALMLVLGDGRWLKARARARTRTRVRPSASVRRR